MFAPPYNLGTEPPTWHGPASESDQDAAMLSGWRYGPMTPPKTPTSWYRRIVSDSAKQIIQASIEQIGRIEGPKLKEEVLDQLKGHEAYPSWRYGQMTPPEEWYDRFLPKSILALREIRRKQQWERPKANELEEIKEEIENESKKFSNSYGDVDHGHCAASDEWTEQGACMCTITWRLPGRFPRSFCETIWNGVAFRTGIEKPLAEPSPIISPIERETSLKPCWEVEPVPGDSETKLCWVKEYNPQLQRYEYVAKPSKEDGEEGIHEGSHGIFEWGEIHGHGNGSPGSKDPGLCNIPGPSMPHAKITEASSSSCSRKPPWLQHVRRFVRAEELDSPPPAPATASQFPDKTGTVSREFSEGYRKVAYYDPKCRKFRYADPQTIDMDNLKIEFRPTVPPPKPLITRKPKPLPKRPLVMAQRKEPVKIRMPVYDPRPRYEPPPVRVPVRQKPKPAPTPEPCAKNPYHSPRFVMFPPSSRDPLDDTPCPPPRKRKPKKKVKFKDDDGEYLPVEDDKPLEWEIGSPSRPHVPEPLLNKVVKRKRRRRDSDPMYRQHGVRENDRIEKGDLQQMRREEVGGNVGKSVEDLPAPHLIRPKHSSGMKPILKMKDKKDSRPTFDKNNFHDAELAPPQASKSKEGTWGRPQEELSHNNPIRRENASKDGEYIPFQDHEEEKRERIDVHDMENQVDKEDEDQSESEQSDNKSESPNPIKAQKKIVRKRKALEDRAYKPGRHI
ncbi:hypothetical protein TWF718_006909 [Orbilia javanica]|uniref:Uncharacterized protein n=1 Tax=Orbilia javanica TaxID=47235 RepID=A0AAN8MQV6_9PEZI